MITLNSHLLARLGALGAIPVLGAAVVTGAGSAHADNVFNAPDHHMVKTLADGTVVTMDLTNESAVVSPSLGGLRLHRNATVSGRFHVHIDGTTVDPSFNLIYPGYTVGCSINISGGGANGNSANNQGGSSAANEIGTGAGGTLSLGPGQQQDFSLIDTEQPDNFGADSHYPYNQYSGNDWSFNYSEQTIALTGCAGPAQARAFMTVQVNTANVRTSFTLYSEPFSLNL